MEHEISKPPKGTAWHEFLKPLSDVQKVRAITMKKYFGDLELVSESLKSVISTTLLNREVYLSRGWTFYPVGAGTYMWFVCDAHAFVDGPYTQEEAYSLADNMNEALEEARDGAA